jgi:spore germination protein KA
MFSEVDNVMNYIRDYILNAVEILDVLDFNKAVKYILSGYSILFINGCNTALAINTSVKIGRNIEEAYTEVSIRGPRQGFVENIHTNISLVRKIINSQNLVFEYFQIGEETHTDISIAYIKGIANERIVEEVKKRLNNIHIDAILESGYIEQLIEDNPLSPFATVGNSEKPDKVAAKILEGRIAIFCNGTPFVLTVPYLFIEALQASEDYYSRPILSTIIRIIRVLAFLIALVLPAFYVAITTYHQEMIPTILIMSFAASREGIPFPIFLEMLISETIFMLVRESGLRMPRAIGAAVSIVGTLVIGQTAVEAGLIGAPMVIVTSLTAITSFIITPLYDSVIVFRIILIFLSGALGIYGIFLGLFCMLAHMCSLKCFETPYMSPLGPFSINGLKDSFIRSPLWLMNKRPSSITWKNSNRQGNNQMPKKTSSKKGEPQG